jgi:hypothetical protein
MGKTTNRAALGKRESEGRKVRSDLQTSTIELMVVMDVSEIFPMRFE